MRLYRWAASAALGGLVFGYQLGVISGALLSIRRDFGLGALQQGVLVSALPLAAMAGSLVAGRLADGVGRRTTLVIGAGVFLAGIGLGVVAPGYALLVGSRAIVGLAVGIVSSAVPLYLSEIAPPAVRGRLVTLQQLAITVGILVAYCVDLAFASAGSWRAMFAVGLLPAAALLVAMLRAPETPAWLDAHGRDEEARELLGQVAGPDEVQRLLAELRRTHEQRARQLGVRELPRADARAALAVGVTLAALQQLCGINAIIAYAPTIMERTGLSAAGSIRSAVAIGALNVAVTFASVRLVDRLGRRPLLLASLGGMLVSLTLLGFALEMAPGPSQGWLALAAILAFIASFAVGLGPIAWLLIAEIFPAQARAAGAGVSTATIWLTNFAVGLVFLPVLAAIGPGATFWIFAGVCALGLAFVLRYVPETKGRSFSEIDAELRERWGSRSGGLLRASS
jgi:sugar porter (SP) family MFS transporter